MELQAENERLERKREKHWHRLNNAVKIKDVEKGKEVL